MTNDIDLGLIYIEEPIAIERTYNSFLKRTFDIFFSLFILTTIFPIIFIIIGILIKYCSPGPIFFKQIRTGKNGKNFMCYKFRSMCVNEKADIKQATANDSRVTKWGKFLRKSNLDEFPQFFNVLLGNMSVVGPRPHMLKHTDEYSKALPNYKERLCIKPGITGFAQVKGFRGAITAPSHLIGRVNHDIYYIKNWSLFFDLKIILTTISNIFKGEENAY